MQRTHILANRGSVEKWLEVGIFNCQTTLLSSVKNPLVLPRQKAVGQALLQSRTALGKVGHQLIPKVCLYEILQVYFQNALECFGSTPMHDVF